MRVILVSLFAISLSTSVPVTTAIARDLSTSELPQLGERETEIASHFADARVSGDVNEMYFVNIAGHHTTFRPQYYSDHGVKRLAAAEIGNHGIPIPDAAIRAFLEHFTPADAVAVSRGNYTEREKIEADAPAGETDKVYLSKTLARNLGATKACQEGVSTKGLVTASSEMIKDRLPPYASKASMRRSAGSFSSILALP